MDAFRRWHAALSDVELLFLKQRDFEQHGYFAQGDTRLWSAPVDTDVVVLVDADTMPIGPLEEILDRVFEERAVAGTVAHFSFPTGTGPASMGDWMSLAAGLIERPLKFDHTYTLASPDEPERAKGPFYVNFGVVFIAGSILPLFRARYRALRQSAAERMHDPYFSAQVALTLAVTDLDLNAIPLPLTYNFPNDPSADARYPDALADIRILHYLRPDVVDRNRIFTGADAYSEFLGQDLSGSNLMLQRFVRDNFGSEFPFQLA